MKGVNKQFVQLIIMDPFRKDNIVLETKLYNEDCIVAMKKNWYKFYWSNYHRSSL